MAIQMRRGALDKLDRSKLLPGEFAICEDGTVVICYATGKTKVVTSLELENARVSADGTVYETLKERLDQEYNQLTKELENDFSQLSEEIGDLKASGVTGILAELTGALRVYFTNVQTILPQIAYVTEDNIGNTLIQNAKDVVSVLGGGTVTPEVPDEPDVPEDVTLSSITHDLTLPKNVGSDLSTVVTLSQAFESGKTYKIVIDGVVNSETTYFEIRLNANCTYMAFPQGQNGVQEMTKVAGNYDKGSSMKIRATGGSGTLNGLTIYEVTE